jgi:ATP-binding protein involved in chromosome partitioning
VEQVEWGRLDVLLIDLPPGTADLQQQLLSVVALDGAIVVIGPQDVAHLDGKRFLDFIRGAGVPILGGVENMSGLLCPHCGERIEVFTRVPDERSIWSEDVAPLGRIPLDPALGTLDGVPAQAEAFDTVAARAIEALEQRRAA